MSATNTNDVVKLRESTGVGIVAAKKALDEAGGDLDKALSAIRKSGQKIAATKASRAMREGAIGHYVHANGKVAALVVVTCETDFVARNETFQGLVHDLALHIAAMNPKYLKPGDIPQDVLKREREVFLGQVRGAGKAKSVVEKILEGKLEKFYEETCLVRQRFVKDEVMTITDLLNAAIQKLGENIQIREFIRLSL